MSADPFSPDTDPCEPLEEDAVDSFLRGEPMHAWLPPNNDREPLFGTNRSARTRFDEPALPRTWRDRVADALEEAGGWVMRATTEIAGVIRG